METINAAIKELVENVAREEWSTVWVAVAPSTVSLTFQDGREPLECRVRFLSFLGIGQNVQQAAFIMHTAQVNSDARNAIPRQSKSCEQFCTTRNIICKVISCS